MNFTLRRMLAGALIAACSLGIAAAGNAQSPKVLKLSHQFPVSTGEDGDFRDRLAKKFAAEVEKRTNGQVKVEVYPNGSLVKTFSQFGALRKGTLDMSVLPLAYGGGEVPEMNLGLMPALVTSYDQGLRWKSAPIGKEFEKILDEKGIKILTWVWQAGGIASKTAPIVSPDDAKGMKVRGGSKEMDLMIKGAGGAVTNVPSNEIYNAMNSGVLDAALTSSTSLISFRLAENSKAVTTARNKAIWFMFEPLVISKDTWSKLTPEQQKILAEVGASLEPFAKESAQADDKELANVFTKAGAKVVDMDEAAFLKWQAVAKDTAYKDFAANVKNGQQLLDMALSVK
ncbi:MAG TPA: TRAP transporter substrate-binding protein DctP [Casimicrobiaceae bacterium]|nr:TRAP transporter substrate-binding protein DctP [Casimicrobiaceae bacterium]